MTPRNQCAILLIALAVTICDTYPVRYSNTFTTTTTTTTSTANPQRFPRRIKQLDRSEKLSERRGKTIGESEDLLGGLSALLEGISQGLSNLIKIKQEIILPSIQTGLKITKDITTSPVVQQIIRTKQEIAGKAISQGPELIETVGGFAKAAGDVAGALMRAGACTFGCPFKPTESERRLCRIENCGMGFKRSSKDVGTRKTSSSGSTSSATTSSTTTTQTVEDEYDDYDLYGDLNFDPNNPK